jgi:carboxymethylenebutenolidase
MTVTADNRLEIGGVAHYLVRASRPTTAGVLLIPHVYGIDEFIRDFAEQLAARGMTTLAWNPYPHLPWGAPFTERPPRPRDEEALAAFAACADCMQQDLGLSTLGTLGFCMGGRWVLMFAAREPRMRAAVAAYPSLPAQRSDGQDIEPVPLTNAIACPVQLLYPGLDRVTPRPVFEATQAMLQGRSAETVILHYPEAEHGFMHSPGAANEAATRVARPQVYAFLEGHLTAD